MNYVVSWINHNKLYIYFYSFLDLSLVEIESIIKHITAKFIDISAILKIGKLIGTSSRKSITYPLISLSIPLPNVPPKRYATPVEFQ